MADESSKRETNVAGFFFVDDQCIDCDLCRESAPAFFARDDKGNYSFVNHQPGAHSAEEICNCLDALEGCPVDAIGMSDFAASGIPQGVWTEVIRRKLANLEGGTGGVDLNAAPWQDFAVRVAAAAMERDNQRHHRLTRHPVEVLLALQKSLDALRRDHPEDFNLLVGELEAGRTPEAGFEKVLAAVTG